MPQQLNVLTIGNAIVDIFALCEDSFLQEQGIGKNMMNLVDAERSAALYRKLDDAKEVSGGSAANTAVGVVALGGSAGFAGRVLDDELGQSFVRDIRDAGVHFGAHLQSTGSPTASSIILVTPDAARSMNTHLGACIEFEPGDIREEDVEAAEIVYLEGYLYDAPAGPEIFSHVVRLAKHYGTQISLSLSDPWCAERHREALTRFCHDHVDILFANEEEAARLCDSDHDTAKRKLGGYTGELLITRGANGAFVGCGDEGHELIAMPHGQVVDTTGAGDLFAAGYLHGLINNLSIKESLIKGTELSSKIIQKIGARI